MKYSVCLITKDDEYIDKVMTEEELAAYEQQSTVYLMAAPHDDMTIIWYCSYIDTPEGRIDICRRIISFCHGMPDDPDVVSFAKRALQQYRDYHRIDTYESLIEEV